MANVIEILINAKNNASAEIDKATGGLGKFATAAGIGAAAGSFAGQAIVTAMQQAKSAIIDTTLAQADNVEMLDRMAKYTGISVQKLDLMRQQLIDDGLSADQLSTALRYMREQLNSGSDKLTAFGITSRDAFTALQQMATAMDRAKDVGERAAIATAALGMRNAELADSVARSASNMSGMQAEAFRNGTALTADYLTKMRDLDAAMEQFAKTQKAFGMAMAEAFAPTLITLTKIITALNQARMVFDKAKDMMFLQQYGGGYKEQRGAGRSWESNPTPGGGGGGGTGNAVVDVLANKLDALTKAFTGLGGGGSGSMLNARVGALADAYAGLGPASDSGKEVSDPITKALTNVQEAAVQFGSNFEGSMRSMLAQALTITTSSNNLIVMAFTSLANAVTQTLAEMMARAAAMGLVKLALNFLPTGGVDAKIGKVFGATSSPMSAMRGGGNTFVIQSISSRDAMEDLLNPTGSFRRANDRMRDISVAAMG
jgi:hypothetical protein